MPNEYIEDIEKSVGDAGRNNSDDNTSYHETNHKKSSKTLLLNSKVDLL